jgi:hypothetical protein
MCWMTRGLVYVSSTNVIFSIDTHTHTRVSMKDKTSYLPFILIHMLNIYRGIYSHLPLNGDDFFSFQIYDWVHFPLQYIMQWVGIFKLWYIYISISQQRTRKLNSSIVLSWWWLPSCDAEDWLSNVIVRRWFLLNAKWAFCQL